MPNLTGQLIMAVLTSLAGCLFLFLFCWQQQLPPMVVTGFSLSVPLVLSAIVQLGLLLSIFLYLGLWRLPEFKASAKTSPERRANISRLLRADAYSYLLLPLLVILTFAWKQIGNNLLLLSAIVLALLATKSFFLLELKKLYQK